MKSGITKPKRPNVVDLRHPLSRDLSAWWLCSDGSGSVLRSALNLGVALLTYTGGALPQWGGSPHGGAMLFDGASGRYQNSGLFYQAPYTGEFTYVAWLYQNDRTGAQCHLGYGNGDGTGPDEINISNATGAVPRVLYDGTGTTVALTRYSVGEWHQVALIHSGTTLYGYTDTILEGLDSGASAAISDTQAFCVGGDDNSTNFFNGAISDVRLYNRALSREELIWLFEEPYAGLMERPLVFYSYAGVIAERNLPSPMLHTKASRAQVYHNQRLGLGLVGYWPFADGGGSRVQDISGHGHHATHSNTTLPDAWIGSPYGRAVQLDGSNDSLLVNIQPRLQVEKITMAVRFRVDAYPLGGSSANASVLETGNSGTAGYGLFVGPTGRIGYRLRTSGGFQGAGSTGFLADFGQWVHVVVTYNGEVDGDAMYINGEPQTIGSTTGFSRTNQGGLIIPNTGFLVFGSRNGSSQFFTGALSSVRLYDYPMSFDEVQDLYWGADPAAMPARLSRLIQGAAAQLNTAPPYSATVPLRLPGFSINRRHHLQRSLLAWWPIHERGGSVITDLGPNRLTHQTGAISLLGWSGSPLGSALRFAQGGTNDIQFGHVLTSAWTGALPVSVSAWFRLETGLAVGDYRLVGKQQSSINMNGWGLDVQSAGGTARVRYLWRNTAEILIDVRSEAGSVEPGRWHHVVATYDGSKLASGIRIYIDGRPQTLTVRFDTLGASATSTSADLTIGSMNDTQDHFAGDTTNIRIYERVLTPEEANLLHVNPWADTLPVRHSYLYAGSEAALLARPDPHPYVAKAKPLVRPDYLNAAAGGLAAHWAFNEGGGTRVNDASGQHPASLVNADGVGNWVGSLHGGGLQLDGTNDYLTVAMQPGLQLTRLTLAAWVRLDTRPLSFASILETGNANTAGYGLFADHTGAFGFILKTAGGLQSGGYLTPRPLGHWTHVVVTYNGETDGDALYLDGQAVTIGSLTTLSRSAQGGLVSASSSALTFGATEGTSQFLTGALDDVRLYGRALSAHEVQALYRDSLSQLSSLSSSLSPVLKAGGLFGGLSPAVKMRHKIWR